MDDDLSHLRSTVNHDGAAILDTKQGTITTLNPTGAYIWQALEQGRCEVEIVRSLASETGESVNSIARDVTDFVIALRKQSLISS